MNPDAARILADLKHHAICFDFTRDNLGEDLCKATTDAIAANFAAEQTPDGTPWADLSPGYAQYKAKNHPGSPIGVREGLLGDPDQIAGDVIVFADVAMVTYGTDDDARVEAAAFQQGDPNGNRPPRPFWGFTAGGIDAAGKILVARFRKVIG